MYRENVEANYLLGLAHPTSFIFVRPFGPKGHFASVQKPFIQRVFYMIASLLLNVNIDRPSAFGGELQVFHNGVVVFLPAINVVTAKKAYSVVWI